MHSLQFLLSVYLCLSMCWRCSKIFFIKPIRKCICHVLFAIWDAVCVENVHSEKAGILDKFTLHNSQTSLAARLVRDTHPGSSVVTLLRDMV